MKKNTKMNGLYKAAFILLLVCIALLIAAVAVAYLFDEIYISAILSSGGAFLALLGIIFAAKSKPKKEKPEDTDGGQESGEASADDSESAKAFDGEVRASEADNTKNLNFSVDNRSEI